jgi:signal transduction histidine kinase
VSPLLASHAQASGAELEAGPLPAIGRGERVGTDLRQRWRSVPTTWRLAAAATFGAAAAAGVGYATSKNPAATPAGSGVELRVSVIVALFAVGLYAQTSRIQARMGALLIGAGFLSALWLLNGSSDGLLFSIGVIVAGVIPVSMAFLMLAHPTGHLLSRTEQRFLWLTGGALAMLWLLAVVTTLQPPLKTPLLQCTPRCPANVFSLGSAPDAVGLVQAAMKIAWIALAVGTPFLLVRRARSSCEAVRRSIVPVAAVAAASAMLLAIYVVAVAAGLGLARPAGALYAATAIAVPLAIMTGLARERLFMGQTLAELLSQLARLPHADPQSLMAGVLHDPSLRVAYSSRGSGTYVDSAGQPVRGIAEGEAVAWIEREGRPAAAVLYNPDLEGLGRFVQAAGAAVLIRLEQTQLEADLKASSADLAASRMRLVEMAHAERRRLERDLHDGVQQHLVGVRIRLELRPSRSRRTPCRAGARWRRWASNSTKSFRKCVRSRAESIPRCLPSEACPQPSKRRRATR